MQNFSKYIGIVLYVRIIITILIISTLYKIYKRNHSSEDFNFWHVDATLSLNVLFNRQFTPSRIVRSQHNYV